MTGTVVFTRAYRADHDLLGNLARALAVRIEPPAPPAGTPSPPYRGVEVYARDKKN